MPTKQTRPGWPSHVSFCVPTKFPDEVTSKFFVLDPIWRPFSPFFLPCDRPSKGSGLSELLVAQDTVKMQGIFFLQLTTKGSFETWRQRTASLRLALLTKWKICEQLTGQKMKKSFWVLYSADLLPWRHQWAEFWTDCGLNTRQDLGCFAVKSRNLVINVEEYYQVIRPKVLRFGNVLTANFPPDTTVPSHFGL